MPPQESVEDSDDPHSHGKIQPFRKRADNKWHDPFTKSTGLFGVRQKYIGMVC